MTLIHSTSNENAGPLSGVVVLDITRVVAGPFCSMTLADLGATVIKIERPNEPDFARDFPPFIGEDEDNRFSAFFAQYNRGKLGMTLELGTPRGTELLKKLVSKADILVENFRPGTMDKLGVGPEELLKINPKLVYTAISGFGQTGPYSRKPAFDNSAQAAGGLWSMNGYPDRPPVRVGTIIGDLSATMYAVIGTLAALRHAEQTGEGQVVDVAQQDSVLSLTENAVVSYTVEGKVPGPMGNDHPFVRPYGLYPCKDGYVFFGGYTDKFWRLTCEMFGDPGSAEDPEIDTMTKRFKPEVYERRVRPLLLDWMKEHTRQELEEMAGDTVPLTAIKTIDEVVEDPHVRERDMIIKTEYPEHGPLETFGQPVHLSATPPDVRSLAPQPGEHTETLLRSLADLTQQDISGLRSEGVI